MKYDSYKFRTGKQKYKTTLEGELMIILDNFGSSIDGHGSDDGNYTEAMIKLVELFEREGKAAIPPKE